MAISALLVLLVGAAALAAYQTMQARKLRRSLKGKESDLDRSTVLLVEKTVELHDKNIRLEKWLQSQADFIMISSHQLRTPLTGVKWGLEAVLADADKLDPAHREQVEAALSGTEKMLILVNELLRLVKVESGYQNYNFVSCDGDAWMAETAKPYEKMFRDKKIRFQVNAGFGGASARMDREMLSIVLANLLENAHAYTPEGGAVTCSTRRNGDSFRVEVSDTGIGLDKEARNMVFKRFFRSEESRRIRPEGSCLGLYLSQKIIQEHSGVMDFVFGEPKGATIFFEIPMHKN